MSTITAVLELPWTKPPMSMNDRMHWAQKAKLTKRIRSTARTLAASKRLPTGLDHVSVALVYRPRDRRRRDTDNLMPVLKALCDGLVDHGLVTDDTPQWMTKHMPRLDEPQKGAGGAMWLELTWEARTARTSASGPHSPSEPTPRSTHEATQARPSTQARSRAWGTPDHRLAARHQRHGRQPHLQGNHIGRIVAVRRVDTIIVGPLRGVVDSIQSPLLILEIGDTKTAVHPTHPVTVAPDGCRLTVVATQPPDGRP